MRWARTAWSSLVQAYFRVASSNEELECGDLLTREILEQARRLGIDVAVGGRTIPLAGPGSEGHAVPPAPKLASRERLLAPRQGLMADADGRGGRDS